MRSRNHDSPPNHRLRIHNALTALLARRNAKSAFVIFEDPATRKFVQFAGSPTQFLLLDLPWQTLSELEFYRAVRFFRALGVAGNEHDALDRPGGTPIARQFSFNVSFQSVDEAADTATRVFREIFESPLDMTLAITEN